MQENEVRERILQALAKVAPEVEPGDIRGDEPLRDQVDLDSFDFLTFLTHIAEDTGIEIPEREYQRIETVDQLTAYVSARQGSA